MNNLCEKPVALMRATAICEYFLHYLPIKTVSAARISQETHAGK